MFKLSNRFSQTSPIRIKSISAFLLLVILPSCQPVKTEEKRWNINEDLYQKAKSSETKLRISIQDQQAWLLDGQSRVLLKTEVSTGVTGRETPLGDFKVLERLVSKRSNRYGKYVHEDTGEVMVEKSWLQEGPLPKGAVFQGTAMPYWMRLTWWGVGMHVGKFPRRAISSFGCVRVYEEAQPLIFDKTQIGTPVSITSESLVMEMLEKESFSRF